MKKIIMFSIALSLVGCGSKPSSVTNDTSREANLQSLDSAEWQNGLPTRTSDTAFTTEDEQLMHLLDTLNQHVEAESFPSEVKREEKWMSDFRSRLSAYYDSHSLGSDTVSIYAKADTVLNKGIRLLELDNHWSTMEMIMYNSTVYTYDRLREYGLLTQVINSCENERAKELVYKEWSLYEQMLKKIEAIASNMVCLNYWGGSITGPLSTASYLQILKSRRDMYQTILDIMKGDGWDTTGVYLCNAERFLFDCCATSLKRIIDESDEFVGGDEGNEQANGFYETTEKTKVATQELRPIINEWISLIDEVDEELTHYGSRHSVERAASYMLMKWASIVTE